MTQILQSLSVIIPLYNHEQFIAQALESVYSQSVLPREVIIVDDGSCDASLDIAQEVAACHPETILWSQPHQGAHHAINAGIHRSTSDLVAILNSDDVYHQERFAECLPFFAADPNLTAVCTGLAFIDENGKPIQNSWYDEAWAFYERVNDLSLGLINGNFFMTTSNLIIRRAVFDEIGYFSRLRYTHDLDFFLRLLLHRKRVRFHARPLLSYRIHNANTIAENPLLTKLEWAASVAFFVYNLPKNTQSWTYYAQLVDILKHHDLTRLLLYFFAYFDTLPPAELSCDTFMQDEDFAGFVREELDREATVY